MSSRPGAGALLMAILAGGCAGSSGPTTAPPRPATIAHVTTTTATTTTTTTTATTTTTTTTEPPRVVIAARCDDPSLLVVADIDGDGAADRGYHRYYEGTARLGVCTAAGGAAGIDGGGMTEILAAADLDGDGAAEVLYGGTSVAAAFHAIAVWEDGRLIEVVDADGVPATIVDGYPDVGGDRHAFGCLVRDGVRHLATATFTEAADTVSFARTWWRLDGAALTAVATDTGLVTAGLSPGVIRDVVGDCGIVYPS